MANEAPIKIVAVDDDEAILDIYENGLAALGYEVKIFSNPKKAKEYLSGVQPEAAPDVILMDIMMPGLDGISLMHDIRSMTTTAHVSIIAVSGLNDAATLNDAFLFGAMDYVVKPFEMDLLISKIKKACEVSRQRAPKK